MRNDIAIDKEDVPAVVEIFSNSVRAWFVGLVVNNQVGVLTVRFVDGVGERKEKSVHCEDPRVAYFGTKTGWAPPPGVVSVPSTTRAGQYSYLDQRAQLKYASAELAWQAFLECNVLDVDLSVPLPNVCPAPQPVPASPDRSAEQAPLFPYQSAADIAVQPHVSSFVNNGCDLPAAPFLPGQPRVVDDFPNKYLDLDGAGGMPEIPTSWQSQAGSVAASRMVSHDMPECLGSWQSQAASAVASRMVSHDAPDGFDIGPTMPPGAFPPPSDDIFGEISSTADRDETLTSFVCRGFEGEGEEGVRVVIEGAPPPSGHSQPEGPVLSRGTRDAVRDYGGRSDALVARPQASQLANWSTHPAALAAGAGPSSQNRGGGLQAANVVSAPPWQGAGRSNQKSSVVTPALNAGARSSEQVAGMRQLDTRPGATPAEKVGLPSFSGGHDASRAKPSSQNAYLDSMGINMQSTASADGACARLAALGDARRELEPGISANEPVRGRGLVGHRVPGGSLAAPSRDGYANSASASWGAPQSDPNGMTVDHLPGDSQLGPSPCSAQAFQADLAEELAQARRNAVEAVRERRAEAMPHHAAVSSHLGAAAARSGGPEMILAGAPPGSSGSFSRHPESLWR